MATAPIINPLSNVPRRVRIVEVGPRDGLQNEPEIVPTAAKLHYVQMLTDAGFSDIEVTSFVSPKRVPQLADAEQVFAALNSPTGLRYSALVPNHRGLDRALAVGVKAIALFTAASESFTQKNIGMTIAESLTGFRDLIPTARENELWVRAYVSTAFVCPYEGIIAPAQVLPVVEELQEMGVDEISIGDTTGHAVPTDIVSLIEAILHSQPSTINSQQLAFHFHDTHGCALANVLTAMQYGIATFDSASGGVGGCPFAPGAAGNLATEDLLGMLHGMGIETGIDLHKVVAASRYLASILQRPLPSKYLQAVSTIPG